MSGTCPRCKKFVVCIEEKYAIGKIWHANCFLCANCNKRLDSMNVTVNDGEAFCKKCYKEGFEEKGYGNAIHSDESAKPNNTLHSSLKLSMSSNLMTTNNKQDDRAGSETYQGTTKYTPYLAQSRYSSTRSKSFTRSKSPTVRSNKFSIPAYNSSYRHERFRYGDDICGRCQKKVYVTENVSGAGTEKSWHQACYKCKKCEKRLDSISVQTYQGELYCVACSNNYHSARKKF